jgi:hypothetical protein
MEFYMAILRAKGKIIGHRLLVLQKILSYHISPITKAEYELLVAEVRIVAHEVPQDRPVTDVDQRLRNRIRVLP